VAYIRRRKNRGLLESDAMYLGK